MRIELQNKKTKEVITFDNISDLNNGEKLFYKFSINASSLEDGEYSLSLFDGDNLIATDTLCVGEFDVNGLQYKKGESIYIENILNTKIEDKVVSVNDIKTTVLPTEGYDAMATVAVNAQPVYDKGYFDGTKSATQNTDVLTITENGFYPTQYSNADEIPESYITGYNEDGTPFYSYARIKDRGYKLSVDIQNPDIELWWKPDLANFNIANYRKYNLCRPLSSGTGIYLYTTNDNPFITVMYNGKEYIFEEDIEDKWYHIILSNEDGFVVNGVKVADIPLVTPTYYKSDYYINVGRDYDGYYYVNGYYGVLKVNNSTYIPTENGFVKTPNIPLDVVEEGEYEFTNPIPPFEGNLIKTINVDVKPKLSIAKYNLKFSHSNIKDIPEWADMEGVTNLYQQFYFCNNLKTLSLFDTSKVTDMEYMFYNCYNLQTIPLLNTSNVTTMRSMFASCRGLTTVPLLDTSNVTEMESMFDGCQNLTTIPQLNTSKVKRMSGMLANCYTLEYVPLLDASSLEYGSDIFGYSDLGNLTYLSGLKNLKIDWTGYGSPRMVSNLTYESVISILSNLYDFRGNGDSSTTRTIQLHSNHMAMLSDDDKAIATNKGWIITT